MAHSIQQYRGTHLILNDADIIVTISLLNDIVSVHQASEAARSIVSRWKQEVEFAGFGCIDLRFDDLMQAGTGSDALIELLEELRTRVYQFDELIPAAEIGLVPNGAGFVPAKHYPCRLLLELIDRVRQLID